MAVLQRRDPFAVARSLWQMPTVWDEDWFASMQDDISVYETDENVVVEANVAGVPADAVQVSVEGSTVTIKAEFEEPEETKQKKTAEYRRRRSAKYLYTVSIPTPVDTKNVDAQVKDGILILQMPKREEAKPQQIKVKAS